MPAPTEKVYYNMREPKELYRPLSLVKDPKTGLLKQQMPKKGGRKRFSKHFSKKCRKTRRKKTIAVEQVQKSGTKRRTRKTPMFKSNK